MSTRFQGRGNLGAAPVLRQVEQDGETVSVATLRVYFDRQVPKGEGQFEDRGGVWLDVSLWGTRAENAARLLSKGTRLAVSGTLIQRNWTDRDSGEERTRIEVRADHVDLDLARIAHIEYRARETAHATDPQV